MQFKLCARPGHCFEVLLQNSVLVSEGQDGKFGIVCGWIAKDAQDCFPVLETEASWCQEGLSLGTSEVYFSWSMFMKKFKGALQNNRSWNYHNVQWLFYSNMGPRKILAWIRLAKTKQQQQQKYVCIFSLLLLLLGTISDSLPGQCFVNTTMRNSNLSCPFCVCF